jgi:hypothetical protein
MHSSRGQARGARDIASHGTASERTADCDYFRSTMCSSFCVSFLFSSSRAERTEPLGILLSRDSISSSSATTFLLRGQGCKSLPELPLCQHHHGTTGPWKPQLTAASAWPNLSAARETGLLKCLKNFGASHPQVVNDPRAAPIAGARTVNESWSFKCRQCRPVATPPESQPFLSSRFNNDLRALCCAMIAKMPQSVA